MAENFSDPELKPLKVEDEPEAVEAGTKLGKYELVKRLSVGGMAEIFLARAVGLPGFQKLVVVKRILPQLASKPDFLEMFLDEARIAATLQHPNIVQIYDVCVIGGNYFIAMEYLHGEDVRSILRAALRAKRRIPLEQVLQIMMALCSGLHYAHDRDGFDGEKLEIVHRDVSPGNLMITYEGDIKLLDFGIASAAIRAETQTGAVKGKLGYMSPEQARGEPLDRRTDIFAAGVILYELSVGRRLFKGSSDYEILNKLVEGNFVPPRKMDPAFDEKLEKIILRAIERDRDKRYATALDLQMDLEALARERGVFLSTTSLKKFMHELFGNKVDAWRQAQREGRSLVEHLEMVAAYDEDEADQPSAPVELLPQPRPRWKLPALAAASAGVLALAAVALWPRAHAPLPTSAAPTPAAPTENAAPPTAAAPTIAEPHAPTEAPQGTGAIKLVAHPHDAHLSIDGRALPQKSPVELDAIGVGEHVAGAQLDGYRDATRRFSVTRGSRATVTLFLERASKAPAAPAAPPAPPPAAAPAAPAVVAPKGDGTLAIATNPWCTVSVDGAPRGQTPLSLKLPAGRHTVVLDNPEFKIHRQISVTVAPDETVRKKLDFTE
jgi:serine/threonine protein kinase